MERIKIAPNFYVDEFVDPGTYFKDPEFSLKYARSLVHIAQLLRNHVGKTVTINNWWNTAAELKTKGKSETEIAKFIHDAPNIRDYCGFRPKHSTVGSKTSAHRKEGAIDCIVVGMSGKNLSDIVESNAKEFYREGARRIEDYNDSKTWLHIDLREHGEKNAIRIVGIKAFVRWIRF